MPHYKNGQPAKVHDLVIHAPSYPNAVHELGIIVQITPSEACNAQLIPVARKWPESSWIPVSNQYNSCGTLKDCLPVGGDPAAVNLPAELTEAAAPQADGDPRPVSSI